MSPNAAAVRELFRAFESGGLESVISITDPDVTWYPTTAGGRMVRGHQELREHYGALAAHGVELHARMDQIEELGDAVLVRGSLRVERWGELSESTVVWLYRLRDGKVREAWTFHSRAEAVAALLMRGAPAA